MAKNAKNLIKSRDQYNKYYGNFRGVDFSSDHSMVSDQRLSYSVNMYRDYQSSQGHAIETIPGFRIVQDLSMFGKVRGIHVFKGAETEYILLHQDTLLVVITDGKIIDVCNDMNLQKSVSVQFNNALYILDGKNFLSVKEVCITGENGTKTFSIEIAPLDDENLKAYIPTLYINTGLEEQGERYEQRNLLTTFFKRTHRVEGYRKESVTVGTEEKEMFVYVFKNMDNAEPISIKCGTWEWNLNDTPETLSAYAKTAENGKNILLYSPTVLTECVVEITYQSKSDLSDKIKNCTILTLYDDRIFASGNPEFPDIVYYCHRNTTGLVDPTYWGELNYFQDGIGNNAITGMMTVTDTLVTLREGCDQAGFIYYHTPKVVDDHLIQVTYPKTPGLNGVGCVGACVNFLDDPIFISPLGIEGIGQLSVRYERAIEHRSSLIDSKLLNLGQDKLRNASITEWNGYLVILIDGEIFMADSRQRYTDLNGVMQYEWFYLNDIGVPVDVYRYASKNGISEEAKFDNKTLSACGINFDEDHVGQILYKSPLSFKKVSVEDGDKTYELYSANVDGEYYFFQKNEELSPAIIIKNIGGNLYFGTASGHFCCFNFDQRNENGEIESKWYTFAGRPIFSGCATKMDNCGIPHLAKSTVNKSLVVKTKSMTRSAVKIKVRTNKKPFHQIARINSGLFSFSDMDFDDFSFDTTDEKYFALKEKEKQWIEKQYFIYSDELQKPFALYYIAYRYTIAGRIKS